MKNTGNPHKRSPHSHFFAGSSVKMKVWLSRMPSHAEHSDNLNPRPPRRLLFPSYRRADSRRCQAGRILSSLLKPAEEQPARTQAVLWRSAR